MSTDFITNEKKLLKDLINNILPATKSVYFLVGYFYFSGFELLQKQLEDKNIKILIGMDIDKTVKNKIREYYFIEENKKNISISQVQKEVANLIVQSYETDRFDNAKSHDSYRIFKQKLKEGTLEIRKTKTPNHAKLYLFEHSEKYNQGGSLPGTIITGSSNLSASGLASRFEINVLSRTNSDYENLKKLFDELWEKQSLPIFDRDNFDYFEEIVDKRLPIDKLPIPYLMYVRMLYEYFNIPADIEITLPASITDNKYYNLQYQIDAIKKGLQIINRHNGVIIADVVGLGKSIIASVIASNLRLKTIIIAPPHLKSQWNDYRMDFDFNAVVYSSGSINKAVEDFFDDDREKLIIVDEAHKYRNENTQNYAELHKLCQGNKVILLSATPFNNKPQDIFSLIKLFQVPSRSTIQSVNNLYDEFRKVINEYKEIRKAQREDSKKGKSKNQEINKRITEISNKIRDIISPVIVRRTRIDLEEIKIYKEDLEMQNISFPEVKDPKELDYPLGELAELYINTLETINNKESEKGFIGARYQPVIYLKNFEKYKKEVEEEFGNLNLFEQSQRNLASFMRRLLARRFESSIVAFKKTLESMINSSEVVLDWHDNLGLVPIYKKGKLPDVETLEDMAKEDQAFSEVFAEHFREKEIEKYKKKGLVTIPAKDIKKAFVEDIKKDIKLLKEIHKKWFSEGIKSDPKLETFRTLLSKMIKDEPDRKIVVFSEFSDTVNYLYEKLKDKLRVFKYTSADSSKKNKNIIKENFDASYKRQKNDYDILIATDAISEGYNLNRAGTIFNYDIPYNPTRVIQRVGRINRISKKVFDKLYIYNYFPTEHGEKEIHTGEISKLKISVIQALLGADTKVLTAEEVLNSFFNEEYKEKKSNEELSWDTKYYNYITFLKKEQPHLIEEALKIPKRTNIQREQSTDKRGVLIFAKKGGEHFFKFGNANGEIITLSAEEAINMFEATELEKPHKVSNDFEEIYQKTKKNMFVNKTQVTREKSVKEAIAKINFMKNTFKDKKEYFDNLLLVMRDYNDLPEKYAKMINSIADNKLQEGLALLEKQVSNSYLLKIINRAHSIDDETQILILSEEFTK